MPFSKIYKVVLINTDSSLKLASSYFNNEDVYFELLESYESFDIDIARKILSLNFDVLLLNIKNEFGFNYQELIENLKKKLVQIVDFKSFLDKYKLYEMDKQKVLDEVQRKMAINRSLLNLTSYMPKFDLNQLKHESFLNDKKYEKRLPVKIGNRVKLIKPSDVLYIIASSYYAEIYTLDKKNHLIRESLSKLESFLKEDFIRIHRSYIVNTKFIDEIIYSDYSEIDVKITDGKMLRVSKKYRKNFSEFIEI